MFELRPDLLLDPLFHLPLAAGLLLALALPPLGSLLLLRGEWLAALGLAHLAGAAALLGFAIGLPALLGGVCGALLAAGAKTLLRVQGNIPYAFMILVGWSTMLLIAANTRLGHELGQALLEGQLYFAGAAELSAAALLGALLIWTLPRLQPQALRDAFFPRFARANRLPAWRWQLALDALVAVALAIATATLGLMAAFALVLIPAWLAFRIAPSWRWTQILAAGIGVATYLLAFAAALVLDQPFGPLLVLLLLGLAALLTGGGALGRALLDRWAGGRP